jgi:hypothetical protein
MRIGLDLDGTIVIYDEVFHRHAVEQFGLPRDSAVDKTAVRAWMRRNDPGEAGWIELQRIVYGLRISEAKVAPGLPGFLRVCHNEGVGVSIISHKSRYSVAKPPVDLHAAALGWLDGQGFFDANGLGIERDRVFFEPTREAKIRRIVSERCALYVDDLEEVFAEPGFPRSVERWLYSSGPQASSSGDLRMFSDWDELARRTQELTEVHAAD